ncbi:MAG: homoserine O-acetyltransferase [Deltaproteobacteria bacterium]|nr:homoserine O-acetyltransferase [Deltaproteobacteria bacterium]
MSEYAEINPDGASVGPAVKRRFSFASAPEDFRLESGAGLGPITLAYETFGNLNSGKTNAILVLHALSGDSHAAGAYSETDARPGWWDIMIGPGKGIDTDKYFVICSNVLGGCMGSTGPSSVNPETGRPYGLDFPMVTIGDMVRAQRRLVHSLGIERLLCVIGGSMGGMQALDWALRYPDMTALAIPIAATSRHSALAIAFNETARQAIMADPAWLLGDYYGTGKPVTGLAVARMIGHITYLSDEAMREKFGRRLKDKSDFSFSFDAEFEIESYLHYQGKKFVERFDPNSFLFLTRAADYFDLAREWGNGSLVKAFSRARARFLVISFASDWLYPSYQSREIVRALKKNNAAPSFVELDAKWGHDAFLLPDARLSAVIGGFLTKAGTAAGGKPHAS